MLAPLEIGSHPLLEQCVCTHTSLRRSILDRQPRSSRSFQESSNQRPKSLQRSLMGMKTSQFLSKRSTMDDSLILRKLSLVGANSISSMPHSRVRDILRRVRRSLTPLPVIGDRLVTPSSFVYLLIKARLVPPVSSNPVAKVSEDAANNEQRENEFLNSRKEVEELADEQGSGSWVHAPYWPSVRHKTFSRYPQFSCYDSRVASRHGGPSSQTQRPIGSSCHP